MPSESPIWPAQLDHLHLESDDPKALADFYCGALGFTSSLIDDETYLLQGVQRRLLVGPGKPGNRACHAFRLQDERQLEDVRAFVASKGLKTEAIISPVMRPDSVGVRDPDGWLSIFGLPSKGVPMQKASNAIPAAAYPGRLQHVVVASPNLADMMDFYEDALGFEPSDYVLDDESDPESKRVAFYRTDPEHHSFAVFSASEVRADHHAYETSGWMDIRDWADHLSNLEVPMFWAPGRHGPGNNLFFMFRDLHGDQIEMSAEIEIIPREMAARTWPATERTLNLWGSAWIRN